jgi:hypothetical protein
MNQGIPLDEVVHFDEITSASTGAAVDADSTPTFAVFEEATDTPILAAQNFTKRTSLTGNYRGTFTCSTANGFEVGKWYNVISSATVGGFAGKKTSMTFRVVAAETVVGVSVVDVTHSLGVAVTNSDGTAQAGGATSITLAAGSSSAADFSGYVGKSVLIVAGTGAGQSRVGTAYNGTTKVLTVHRAWDANPDATSQYLFENDAAALADALLLRSVRSGAFATPGGRSVAAALAFLRNKWASVGGTLTVYDTDDATSLWTATLSGDSAAQPVVGSDPA